MPSVVQFDFVDSKSGKITYSPPGSYVAATGPSNCQTGQNTVLGTKWRAFFNFDTSSLPDNALISMVEFLVRKSIGQPSGDPQWYQLKFSVGTFIGAALNGTAAEFSAGTLMVTLTGKPADNSWLDLNDEWGSPELYVNRTGDTDIKVWDDSTKGNGDPSWGINFNYGALRCALRITYTVPSATATGRGTASASAAVTTAGRATATGSGTAQAAATVRASGAASATGRGTASLTGTVVGRGSITATGSGSASALARVIVAGGATSTGIGTTQATAVVTAFGASIASGRGAALLTAIVTALGSGTATGRGIAEGSATVALPGSCSATGRGTAELIATVIAAGIATATGLGTIEVAAWVTASASAAVTGRGMATCDGQVEERTASATATGYGFAWCHLTEVYFDPLARHFGTRAVRAASAGVRSVASVHRVSRACDTEDARTCGARRAS